MPAQSVAPATPAGIVPGLLRRAWRAVAAVAGAVRAEVRDGRARPLRVTTPARGRGSLVRRRLWLGWLPAVPALPLTGLELWRHAHRLWLAYPGPRYPGWPGGGRIGIKPDALCRHASLNPVLWFGGARLPTAEEWQEHHTPSRRRLHEGLARNDRRRPLAALRRRWRRLALRRAVRATPPAAVPPTPASPRGWPPALASPLRG